MIFKKRKRKIREEDINKLLLYNADNKFCIIEYKSLSDKGYWESTFQTAEGYDIKSFETLNRAFRYMYDAGYSFPRYQKATDGAEGE